MAHKNFRKWSPWLYYWFLSFIYDEIFDVQKKPRAPEASGYLVDLSETAPQMQMGSSHLRLSA